MDECDICFKVLVPEQWSGYQLDNFDGAPEVIVHAKCLEEAKIEHPNLHWEPPINGAW